MEHIADKSFEEPVRLLSADVIELMTELFVIKFSAKLYGKRSHKNKLKS